MPFKQLDIFIYYQLNKTTFFIKITKYIHDKL